MINRKTTFTIITPAYNAEKYICGSIGSVCKANYDLNCIEHIVVDDGSTDNTENIVKNLMKIYPHVQYIKKQNGNWGSVINYVKKNKLAHNDYILVLDSDDQVTPDAFKIVDKNHKNSDLFIGAFNMTDRSSKNFYIVPYYYMFKRNIYKNNAFKPSNVSKALQKNAINSKEIKKIIYSPLCIPCNTYIKNDLFYKSMKLKEGVSHQDLKLYSNLSKHANYIRFTPKKVGIYWKYRAGNTMSEFTNESHTKEVVEILQYMAAIGYYEPVILFLLSNKHIRKYCKKNKIMFSSDRKMKINWLPWYASWVIWLLYFFWLRRYFKIVK